MSATDVTLIFKLYDITTFAVDIDDVNVPILASLPFVKSFTFCVKKLRLTFFGWKYTTLLSKVMPLGIESRSHIARKSILIQHCYILIQYIKYRAR